MRNAVSQKGDSLRKAIIPLSITGIMLMFAGLALKLADVSGFTTAFIVGAALIIFSRLIQWLNPPRQNGL